MTAHSPKLFDVHTHVQFHAFKDDADLVIQRAREAGVWTVNVGTQKDTSEKAVRFAHRYPEGVFAAVGLHPIHTEASYHDLEELGSPEDTTGFTSRGEKFAYEYYKNLAEDPKTVAIGECGMDYYRLGKETKGRQKDAFIKQIELSVEVKKPLMIHCRKAFSDLIGTLEALSSTLNTSRPGIIHFFSGTKEDARALLAMGFSFSFGGVITFARDYDEVIRYIPLDRIMLETDAPYVSPVPHRGRRNEPANIVEVVKKLAELKNSSIEDVSEITTVNARKLFGV